ncbi:MAG: ABC-ATPase domain-containing protein [Lachnospiraceae bacterium]|nr:ABC-ATPase domain-containing protein [Lachnospiraceae bacterium]
MKRLEQLLHDADHKPYPAYKALKGFYSFPGFVLSVDHVQGDPFAAPSSLSIRMKAQQHAIPRDYYEEAHRRVMLQDFLLRRFCREMGSFSNRAKGSGKSGTLSVSRPQQEVLERSALCIDGNDGSLILRFSAGFPAAGRTTLAMELKKMLTEYVPSCVSRALLFSTLPKEELSEWMKLADEQKAIRGQLKEKGLIAFVADGAILPRLSGVDERPMKGAVPFVSPEADRVTLSLPGGKSISGLGIRSGITLIVGGGYHGKSTLLKALERGVYNHIPGDGREYVITEESAMKIRSEDGRSVKQLDISAFIRNLPNKKDTVHFSTEDASGSTSQAAGTVEAVLSGASTILIDEDTSATNFLVRDALMQSVIQPEEEPIIPFLGRMRSLYESFGVSTILVAGSSGAFFTEADAVLQMKEYRPLDITKQAKEAAAREGLAPAASETLPPWKDARVAFPNREVTDSRRVKVRGSGTDSVSINRESVELRFVEQVVDHEQTNLLGAMLRTLEEHYFNGRDALPLCVEHLLEGLRREGFSAAADGSIPGNLAMVRPQELWAMVNRYRSLQLGG